MEILGALGAIGAALGTAVSGLGFVTLRAREALLGLSPGLSYPKQEWLVTGFDTLGALLWRGLSVLASDYPVLTWSAWALLLLFLGLLLARSTRRTAILLGVLAVSALVLVVGSAFYRTALAASSPREAGASRGSHCGAQLSANLMDRAAFETCSWLVNDTPRNDERRSDLGLPGHPVLRTEGHRPWTEPLSSCCSSFWPPCRPAARPAIPALRPGWRSSPTRSRTPPGRWPSTWRGSRAARPPISRCSRTATATTGRTSKGPRAAAAP